MGDVNRMTAQRSEAVSEDLIRGVASTTSNADRSRRVFLPGAFGTAVKRVPLLAYHDDTRPIGSSLLTPDGAVLRHESRLADIPAAQEFRELVKAGAIPATSIGWVSEEAYQGWTQLEKARPALAAAAEAAGAPKSASHTYYADAEIVENSLVPVPANPLALLSAASLLGGRERAVLDDLIDLTTAGQAERLIAAGRRNSSDDQTHIQDAHDATVRAGAECLSGEPGSGEFTDDGDDDNQASMRQTRLAADLLEYEQGV